MPGHRNIGKIDRCLGSASGRADADAAIWSVLYFVPFESELFGGRIAKRTVLFVSVKPELERSKPAGGPQRRTPGIECPLECLEIRSR